MAEFSSRKASAGNLAVSFSISAPKSAQHALAELANKTKRGCWSFSAANAIVPKRGVKRSSSSAAVIFDLLRQHRRRDVKS